MAQAICQSIVQSKFIPRSQILFLRRDPQKMRKNEQQFGITSATLETIVSKSDLILLCVRPAQAEEVLKELSRIGMQGKKLISILAGKTLAFFEKFLGPTPLIRAMPNIASEVGAGMTLLSTSATVDPEFLSHTTLLFKNMGEAVTLPEKFMDLMTGMAGSGPAFVCSLIDAAARLGEKEGVPYETSLKIAAQTFLGASRLLLEGKTKVSDLLFRIAVPGGTTEAGLRTMQQLEVEKRFQQAIEAAAKRAKELS